MRAGRAVHLDRRRSCAADNVLVRVRNRHNRPAGQRPATYLATGEKNRLFVVVRSAPCLLLTVCGVTRVDRVVAIVIDVS